MEIFCIFAGIAFFYTQSIFALLLLPLSYTLQCNRYVFIYFILAILWALIHQGWVASKNMPPNQVIDHAVISGRIASVPIKKEDKIGFQFLITRLNNQSVKALTYLTCLDNCPTIKEGEFWQFQGKIKQPHNLANPGSFDYISWLNARHIQWIGYIHGKTAHYLSLSQAHFWMSLRNYLATLIQQTALSPDVIGIFQALTLGFTEKISRDQWELFRHTGTSHLMVISGAHVGLVAGLCFWLFDYLWRIRGFLCLYYPSIKIASVISFIFALCYSLLAGFAIPAQRALITWLFILLKHFLNYRFMAWQVWRYALLIILLFEPHAVLMPGFYLSFIAVAILLLVSNRFSIKKIKQLVYLQLGCLFGLMPLTLYWFSYASFTGFLANLLAIPWVGFIIVPLSLINLALLPWFPQPITLYPLELSIQGLLLFLNGVAKLSFLNLTFSFSNFLYPLMILTGLAVLLLLPIKALLPAACLLIIGGLFPKIPTVKLGNARIDIVDVGQGLAVVIKTANHTLIYDTGAKFYRGDDMANLALIPYLHILRIKKIDKVVISHPDLDHRGGLESLEKKYPINELLVDNPSFYHRGANCHQYPPWQWDGLYFRFFSLPPFNDKNNSSCVLQIKNKTGEILLTGDIEKLAEDYLITTYGSQLKSTVLVLPHHGSQTSSSLHFIQTVSPKYAIISAGFDNRYHFPHPQTLLTLQKLNINYYNTAENGMITVYL